MNLHPNGQLRTDLPEVTKENRIGKRKVIHHTVIPTDYGYGYNAWVKSMQGEFERLHHTAKDYQIIERQMRLKYHKAGKRAY